MNRQTRMLPAELEKQVRKTLEEWAVAGKVRRLWARDATLWTGADEASWLGWLEIAGVQVRRMDDLRRLAEDVHAADRSEEHTPELQSQSNLVCRLLLAKKTSQRMTPTRRTA